MHVTIDHFFGEISNNNRCHSCTDYTMHLVLSPAFIYKKAEKTKLLTDASCMSLVSIKFGRLQKNDPIPKGSSIHIVQPCKYSMNDIRKHYTIKRSADSADYLVFGEHPDYMNKQLITIESCIINENEKVIVASYNKRTFGELRDWYKQIVGDKGCEDLIYHISHHRFYGFHSEEYYKIITDTLNKPVYLLESLNIINENQLTSDLLYMIYMANKREHTKENEENLIVLLNTLNNTNWREHKEIVGTVLSSLTESYWGGAKRTYKEDILANMRYQKSKYPKQITELLSLKGTYTGKSNKLLKEVVEHILHIGEKRFVDFMQLNQKLYKEYIPAWLFAECYNVVCKVTPVNEES